MLDTGAPIEDENALQAAIDSFNAIAAKYYNDTLAASKAAQAAADAASKSAASLKVDTTLTISGYAADAKTVGDVLNNKANIASINTMIQRIADGNNDTIQIGTSATTNLQTYGVLDILASDGYIALRSPNGVVWNISVDNSGTLKVVEQNG